MNYLSFSLLQSVPGLQHAVTTRAGGVSETEYSALNLAFHVGDNDDHVIRNRELLASELGFDAHALVCAQQVHGSGARVIAKSERGRGATNWESALPETDALICAEQSTPVMILVADCAPVLIVDLVHRVLAVVHAGWRGAVGKIASKTLATMQREFGTRPEEVLCGLGPCLCLECLEIGEEVAAQVVSAPGLSTPVVRRREWGKPHLDLRAIIRDDLTSAGVLAPRIEIMQHCPRCENETFFSHRAQNGKAGRFGLVAWWRPNS